MMTKSQFQKAESRPEREKLEINSNENELLIINNESNLIQETKQVNQIVETIRIAFMEKLTEKSVELFENSDLQELRKTIPKPENQEQSLAFRFISRFLTLEQLNREYLSANEIEEIVEKLSELLKFRHQFQVTQLRSDQFCREFFLLNVLFPFGYDKNHLPILYVNANVHRRWSHKLDDSLRRFVVWQVNSMTKSFAEAKIQKSIGQNCIVKDGSFGMCYNCANVHYSCVDIDFLRFFVKLLVQLYPTYCRYILVIDLSWLFRSIWQLVKSWLPEEVQKSVLFITSNQLLAYIDREQIPHCIELLDDEQVNKQTKLTSDKRKHEIPENFESLDNFDQFANGLQLSSSEVKSFKSHVEKVVKHYKELGALPSSIK